MTHVLTLLVLYTRDIAAARQFYTALGLEFTPEQHGGGPHHYSSALPGGVVLELYPCGDRPPTRIRLGLHATDPATAGTTVTDPDGNRIELG